MEDFIKNTYIFNILGGTHQEEHYLNYIGGLEILEEEVQETEDAIMKFRKDGEWTQENRADFLDAIVDTMVVTLGMAFRAGISRTQIEAAMEEVAKQNLNKFSKGMSSAYEAVKGYEDDDRYSNIRIESVEVNGEPWYAVIGDTKNGTRKILKSITWEDPKEKLVDIIAGVVN